MNFINFYESSYGDLIYSGQRTTEPTFDKRALGKGNDQEGVGFYFTTDKDEAYGYAYPSGIIITAKFSGNLIDKNTKLDKSKAIKLIKMSPVLKDVLQDFGYDPPFTSKKEAMDSLTDSMVDEDDAKDTFLQIWYDLYHRGGNDWAFVENMVKLGYDGLLVDKAVESKHIIVYDDGALDIQSVEKYQKHE